MQFTKKSKLVMKLKYVVKLFDNKKVVAVEMNPLRHNCFGYPISKGRKMPHCVLIGPELNILLSRTIGLRNILYT